MQFTIDEFKRKQICPILSKNGWDYADHSLGNDKVYLYGIKEMLRWYGRRGNKVRPESVATSISHYAMREGVSPAENIKYQRAFRAFAQSGYYSRMGVPLWRQTIQMNVSRDVCLSYTPPVMVLNEKTPVVVFYEKGKLDPTDVPYLYEVQLLSVWCDRKYSYPPIIYNLYYEDGEIKEQRIRLKDSFSEFARKNLIKLGQQSVGQLAVPESDICNQCMRRKECPTKTVEETWLRKS